MARSLLFCILTVAIVGAIVIVDSHSPITRTAPSESAERVAIKGICADGVVEGATRDIELRSEVAGRVAEVLVAVNDWVEPEQPLVQMDSRHHAQLVLASQARLELARAQLDRLLNGARDSERDEARSHFVARQTRLEQAQNSWRRINTLRTQNAVSQQQADDQQSEVDALTAEVAVARARLEQLEAPARVDELREAEARVAAAEADHELSQIMFDKLCLRAPCAGRVVDLHVEPGELLGPDAHGPAVVLSDTSKLRVRAYVEEIDAPSLTLGMPARITADGLQGKVFRGTIASLSPRMSPKELTSGSPDELYDTKVREVTVVVDEPESLLLGLRVDVTFLTQ